MNRILKILLQSSRSAVLRFTRGAPSHQIPSRKRLKSSFILIALASAVAFYGFSAHTAVAYPADEFVTTWKTNNTGTSNSTSITIPTLGSGYNYSVDWNNDGVVDQTGITGSVTHDFGSAGTYIIRIKGTFPQIYFNNAGDKSKILSVEQWGTNGWTSMNRSFYGANNLVINAADTPNLTSVTDMQLMFQEAASLGGGTGNWSWNTSSIMNMSNMFLGASNFNKDLSSWDTGNVTNMRYMFNGASSFNQQMGGWNTSKVTDMQNMFGGATAFNQPLNSWNTSKVLDMSGMFRNAINFNQNLNSWDTSKVTLFNTMFHSAANFNGNISNWNTQSATNMSAMFYGANSFDKSISNWNTSSVTNMGQMFYGAIAFNQGIGSWNTGSVTNMSEMFKAARKFNQPIGAWNTSNVTDMTSVFEEAYEFNQPLNSWDTSKNSGLYRTFFAAYKFNQPLNNWNTSKVISMTQTFRSATVFDQDISSWNVSLVTNANAMFDYKAISTDNYDALLTGWNAQTLKPNVSFSGGSSKYCNATAARANLVAAPNNWTVTDGGLDCSKATKAANTHFVTTWKTDNPGTSNSTSITIPTTGSGYSYDVDWDNDGRMDEFGITGNKTHDFGTAGTKTIRIQGAFPRITFYDGGDKQKILSVEQWGTNSWSSFQGAFHGASNLVINASDTPDLSSATSMNKAFSGATSLGGGSGNWNWNTSTITDIYQIFLNTINFNKDISSWDTGNVSQMAFAFSGASSFNQPIGSWNTGKVADMSYMFDSATAFDQPVGLWNTSKVTNLNGMFRSAPSFNQPIGGWDTSKVSSVGSMFKGATSFNQNINDWDTTSLTAVTTGLYGGAFFGASSFNQPLNNWDVSKVTNFISLFGAATSFNQDINNWDTSKVIDMSYIFNGALNFNKPLNNWNVDEVVGMTRSFMDAKSFNRPLDSWDTSNVISMSSMFHGATPFDQDLSSWDVSKVTTASNMLLGTTLSTQNYDALLSGWNAQTLKPNVAFHGGNAKYCAASAARANMISSDSWTISDGGQDCSQAKPTDVKLAGSHTKAITENNALNASMGTLTVTDLTPSDTHSYAFTCTTPGPDDGLFTITGAALTANQSFDYENPADADSDNAYEVCVRVTDSTGNTYDQNLTIAVANVNAAPTGVTVDGGNNKPINENNVANATIATLATVDDGEDNPETYIYSLDCSTPGADDGLFSTSGTDLKANQSFDYENPADANGDNIYNICIKTTETNGGLSFEQNLTITVLDVDDAPPIIPGAPELTDASDTGSSNTDNLTNDTTPSFKVACSEADATVKIYSNQPGANTLIATHACTSVGDVEVAVDAADALADGIHSITSTETDSSNNVSDPSPALTITIDATASAAPTITPPSNFNELPSQSPVVITGTGVVGETITVTSTPDVGGDPSTCTTTVDNDGNYNCSLSPQPELGDHTLSITTTDLAGNTSIPATGSFTMALDTDGDGQIDSEDTDDDGDGIPDEIEDAGFNNGDGNGDGIKDSLQANVATQFNPVTGGSTTLEVTGDCQLVTSFDIVKESELQKQDAYFTYPVGLNDFSLKCDSPGQTATVTFYYNKSYDTSTWSYKKYDTNTKEYTDISGKVTYGNKQVAGTDVTTVSYKLTDGGPLDQDGLVNGEIHDPAGAAVEIPKPVLAIDSGQSGLADTGESTEVLLAITTMILLISSGATMVLRRKS